MPTSSTLLSEQQLITAAMAPILAYNDKNWEAVKAAITPDFIYEEVATRQKLQGHDQVIALWKGWATALPDSKGTIDNAYVSGDKVVLEITWRGTHNGPMATPKGPIPPTGKRVDVRACVVCEMAEEKTRVQRQYFDMATILEQIGVGG